MRLQPHEAALITLEAEEPAEGVEEAAPFSRESAIEFLQLFTGQDFGDDVFAWKHWFALNSSRDYLDGCYDRLETIAKNLRKCGPRHIYRKELGVVLISETYFHIRD